METCWNVTIRDTSPLFKYSPFTDGGTQGWTGVFRDGNQVANNVTFGAGDSQHVTAGQATAEIVFNGTAIYLNGATMGNMQYDVELDGQVTAGQANAGLLASFTNLSGKQQHTLLLRSKPQASGDWLALQSAVITAGTGLTGASFASMTKKQDDPAWSYAPGYTQAANPVTNASMRQSLNAGDWAALTFSGHSVIVHGPRNIDHGQYSVTFEGQTQTFNGTSRVMVNDSVLFLAAGMDSLKTHVVNITNLDNRVMDISYAEIIAIQGGTTYNPESANTGSTVAASGPNIAAILGGVIGALLLLVVAAVGFWFWRRHNKKRSSTEEGTNTPPALPAMNDSAPEMTIAGPMSVLTKPSTGPRVHFGEFTTPGIEGAAIAERSETPPVLRPARSILRRQESNTSAAPLLAPARSNKPDDQVSLESTYSAPDISTSSLAVAPPESRSPSPVPPIPKAPVRPPRPPQNLFATAPVPRFPEPGLSAIRPRTSNEDPFNPVAAQTDMGSYISDSTAVMPNPFEETESTGPRITASPDSLNTIKLQTEDTPQPAPEQRSATATPTQARRDLLMALEMDQVATVSRNGTRRIGLPSNPRAGLSRP